MSLPVLKNKLNSRWRTTLLVIVLSLLLGATNTYSYCEQPSGGNIYIDRYMEENWDPFLSRGIPYPSRTPFIVLRGSWEDMGIQYGSAVGDYISIVYDTLYFLWLNSGIDPEELPGLIDLYKREADRLSPEMIQFIRGISIGAGPALAQTFNAAALSDFDKIFFINSIFELAIPPAWPHLHELLGQSTTVNASLSDIQEQLGFASHSWAVFGDSTASGQTIAGGTRDQPWFPLLYSVAYVAVPNDPKANVVFGHTVAGTVAGSAQVNDMGVYIGNTIIDGTWDPENGIREQALGVPALIVTGHVSFFADSAQEAAEQFTIGTRLYRKRTGRDTLAYTVGFNQLVADRNKALVVERTANHYAVRETGDAGELASYVVLTNHNMADHSFDETATLTEEPMATFGSGQALGSVNRYFGLFYELNNFDATFDETIGQDVISHLKYYYTPEGDMVTEENGVEVWRFGDTPQAFYLSDPFDPDAFPFGGNLMYLVVNLDNLVIRYIQGMPDHWSGHWDSVWLGNPKYRR